MVVARYTAAFIALGTLLASVPAAAQGELDDVTACGGRLEDAPPDARRAQRRCMVERRRARVVQERERRFALHRAPRATLVAGYDGALLVQGHPWQRFRSPSLIVGLHFRQNVLDRLGFFVTVAPTIGRGRLGGGQVIVSSASTSAGVSFAGTLEGGLVTGPFRRLSVTFGAQMRLIIPGERYATVTTEGASDPVAHTVEWSGMLMGLGPARP